MKKASAASPCIPQEDNVRDIQQVLMEKQHAIARVRSEVEALRSLTPLMSEAGVFIPKLNVHERRIETDGSAFRDALQTAGPLLVEEDGIDPEIRARLAEAAEAGLNLSGTSRISRGLRRIAASVFGRR